MKLHDKIYYCRKKAGLSQEAFAEKLGVSRQSVSKWKTGDSVPELSKIPVIAKIFNVTADWLLSEDVSVDSKNEAEDIQKEKRAQQIKEEFSSPAYPQWVNDAPNFIAKILKRFGWLAGVYVTLIGIGFIIFSRIFNLIFTYTMSSSVMVEYFHSSFNFTAPFSLFTGAITIIGAVITLAGLVLTGILLYYSKKR